MSILINQNSRVMTQGITGKTGQFHTRMCREYANGQNCFVAGVNPQKQHSNQDGEQWPYVSPPQEDVIADQEKQGAYDDQPRTCNLSLAIRLYHRRTWYESAPVLAIQ